ncbi:MAG: glycosyltransferase family 39 protein [Anaerolineae bacterium]|nr:glycosyltransferase family 39 protein [Anaerolineae bacterium]
MTDDALNRDAPLSLENLLAEDTPPAAASPALTISFEVLAWAALLALALLLRLANLDTVPLDDVEAGRALTAWHFIHPEAPGTAAPAYSPITFWGQAVAFSILGDDLLAARLPGVISGVLLLLLPLLFRAQLGRERAFLLALLLACSPISIIAGRTTDPALWTVILALAALWCARRYLVQRRQGDVLWLAAFAAALIFLSEPGGLLFLLISLLATGVALWWLAWRTPQELALENAGTSLPDRAGALLRDIPWLWVLVVMTAVVLVTSTLFLVYPDGLSMVGEVIAGFFRGFSVPAQPNAPAGYTLLTLLLLDPLLIFFAVAGVVVLVQQARFGLRERFLVAWIVVGGLVLLFYRGGTPGDALWLVLPLALLAVEAIVELFKNRVSLIFMLDDFLAQQDSTYSQRFAWVKYAVGSIVVALLVMLALHWQEVARGLLTLPPAVPLDQAVTLLLEAPYAMFRYSFIWLLITVLLLLVGLMIAASLWGNSTGLQGLGLGTLVFMLVSGVGGGWNEAVVHASAPGGIWHTAAVTPDFTLLQQTLTDVARRNNRGFTEQIPVTVVMDASRGITDSGLMAWLLREYPAAEFVASAAEAREDGIILMAPAAEPPDLGGTYVGQSFVLREHWTFGQAVPGDWPAWFTQRRLRAEPRPQDIVVLWLRQDVFNALPAGS